MMNTPTLFPDLSQRTKEPELMDCPDSKRQMLDNTLALFETLNRCLTRVRYILKRYIIRPMQRRPEREYHLVDLGAGACETAVWLLGCCRERNLKLRVTACDHDPRVVRYARKCYGSIPNLTILQRNIMNIDDLKPIDFLFANHLLHHLSDPQVIDLLRYLSSFSDATIIINDIERNRLAYTAYYLMSLLLPRNSFVRYDGLVSVRKGFTTAELRELIRTAFPGGVPYRIKTLLPARILMITKNIEKY